MNEVTPLFSLVKTDRKKLKAKKQEQEELEVSYVPVEPPESFTDMEKDAYRALIRNAGEKYFLLRDQEAFLMLVRLTGDYNYRRWYSENVLCEPHYHHTSRDLALLTSVRQLYKTFGLTPLDNTQLNPANKRRKRKISTLT